jgi:hypothetical protein
MRDLEFRAAYDVDWLAVTKGEAGELACLVKDRRC